MNKVIEALQQQEKELILELATTRKMLEIAMGTNSSSQIHLPLQNKNGAHKTHGDFILSVLDSAKDGMTVGEICEGLKKSGMDASSENFYSIIYGDMLRLKEKNKVAKKDKRWFVI